VNADACHSVSEIRQEIRITPIEAAQLPDSLRMLVR
jgi:hypothetical protein